MVCVFENLFNPLHMSSRFPSNSEASASELLGNLEETNHSRYSEGSKLTLWIMLTGYVLRKLYLKYELYELYFNLKFIAFDI